MTNSKTFHSSNRAFTIIEVVVTLLIMGVLATIAGVMYKTYTDKIRIAEAATLIDTITKSETTYFLFNKSFVSFYVPVKSGQQWQIPNMGTKHQVDSTQPSGHALATGQTSTAPWAAMNKPIPDGTSIGFFMWSVAGKNDSQGNPMSGSGSMALYSITDQNSALATVTGIENPTSGRYACITDTGRSYFAANNHVPDKNWVVINAFANFSDDAMLPSPDWSSSSNYGECTRVYKYVETDSHGKVVAGNPIALASGVH